MLTIAILIAMPLFVDWPGWLDSFAYKTDMSMWVFVLASASALLVALFTVSYQSIKPAIANPVDSLRSE